jgi:hypothetical protein
LPVGILRAIMNYICCAASFIDAFEILTNAGRHCVRLEYFAFFVVHILASKETSRISLAFKAQLRDKQLQEVDFIAERA